MMLAARAGADDGVILRRNIPQTPQLESQFAELEILDFYVLAQTADGTLLRDTPQGGILYRFEDDLYPSFTRESARPLFTFYTDGPVERVEIAEGFGGHGTRDAFAALSLDDGDTWVYSNLSQSAARSSIDIGGTPYPGDVIYLVTASAEDKVLAVWASRFCDEGGPSYEIDSGAPPGSTPERDALTQAAVDGLYRLPAACTDNNAATPCLYYDDLFLVGGQQGASDYSDVGYPEVGIVPYSCLWTARGTIEPVRVLPDGGRVYDPDSEQRGVIWRRPERLTSGVRDVYRLDARGVPGAGFVVTWQEDPGGLMPGCGLGPGLGWSGASAYQETDIWYAYLPAEAFSLVDDGDRRYGNPVTLAEYFATASATPGVGIPMSMPVRLSDNGRCGSREPEPPYCDADFDGNGVADFCAGLVELEGELGPITVCVSEDGRLMRGNTSSTRARINLYGYDPDGDGLTDSGWVVVAAEEKKGLGEDELGNEIDLGKNVFYYTFDMFDPEVVSQGLMLNPPASYPDWARNEIGHAAGLVWEPNPHRPGETEWLARIDPDPIYGPASLDTELYQTEIARRFSLIAQPASEVGPSGTVALATYKEGIIHHGGPTDVMARRFVLPAGFDPRVDNPFDYANMECDDWAYTDGSNPRYLKGLCKSPTINLSATTIVTCTDSEDVDGVGPEECAASFPWDDRFDHYDLSGTEAFFARLTTWRTCEEGAALEGVNCTDSDIDDHSWDNPFDLAKGHRGSMDGDFIVVAYAWTPNWALAKVGRDNLDLYARRSFDGGSTWTTTPATLGGEGTAHCETYRDGNGVPLVPDTTICYTYGPGEFEQARNLSRVPSRELTVLDPRSAPTFGDLLQADGSFLYPEDERDHSKYVLSYEVGDATTVPLGEAKPLDMFYGRAAGWGDLYELFEQPQAGAPLIECTPERLLDPANTCRFDALELAPELHSAEAATAANSAGSRFYAHWTEWEEDELGEVIASDTTFRRILWYLDETGTSDDGIDRFYDLSVEVAGSGTGHVQGDYLGEQIIDCGSGGRVLCHQRLAEDLICELWPYEDPDSYFAGWQGGLASTENPLQVAMTRDWSLSALFDPWPACDPSSPDLVLTGMTCTDVDLIVACNSMLVEGDSVVTQTGRLTLRAGDWVAIDDGFVVEAGGQMEIVIRP